MKWVSQEWGVGGKLKLERQGLTELLLNSLLGSEVLGTIGARDLKLGHTAHGFHILKMIYALECVMGSLCS